MRVGKSPCYNCRWAKWDYYPCEGWLVSCSKRDPLLFNPDLVKHCPHYTPKYGGGE